ncbi:DNA-directed RNA polymerase subunit epsilon [Lactiplantibacillus sp. WILCCON 0030]|uniref:DNA-directed RNA polymerase subunit epsilon n=1 Tax=Lactiplantibacillus brownii TaxID=3069269 RepID=A0ABU1A9D7_9LACO|nr:DNA-directed RNA polymerase subunit epsilon [Lactiplantibacillus brownii]MDQ7937596.1 DNA-directed RNA polymerase subunit epsilon [Lactiplantibacillus brownii]
MIYKVYYQETKKRNPQRETTQALYLEAATEVDARVLVEDNTKFNIEFIEPLEGNFLDYEQKNPEYQLTEFNK